MRASKKSLLTFLSITLFCNDIYSSLLIGSKGNLGKVALALNRASSAAEIYPSLFSIIYNAIENNEGYISAALLARFSANATFPRLPFEPISKEEYISLQNKVIERKVNNDFFDALNKYDIGELSEAGPAGCDSDKCLLPLAKPKD